MGSLLSPQKTVLMAYAAPLLITPGPPTAYPMRDFLSVTLGILWSETTKPAPRRGEERMSCAAYA